MNEAVCAIQQLSEDARKNGISEMTLDEINTEIQAAREIDALKAALVCALSPLQIYLFGSWANGSFNEDSDFDIYIVVADDTDDFAELTAKAYRAIREIKKRSVDIIVNSKSHFENRSQVPSLESEVADKGILLYSL